VIAVDSNILVYSRRREFPKHQPALYALRELAEGDVPWALPLFCIGEFLRVVTHPRLFDPPTEPSAALRFVDALLESPTVRLLLPGRDFHRIFGRLIEQASVSGNGVFDTQIAALCIESGVGEILSEDRDFLRFQAIRLRTL